MSNKKEKSAKRKQHFENGGSLKQWNPPSKVHKPKTENRSVQKKKAIKKEEE